LKKVGVVTAAVVAASTLCLASLVGLRLLVGVSRVPQGGMYPTIPAGSTILTWKRPYARGIGQVRRGDIVIFKRQLRGESVLYIWRVIGLPGDRVVATGDALALNGQVVKRELLRDDGPHAVFSETAGVASYEVAIAKSPSRVPPDVDLTIAPGHLFVMGDNRYDAIDSRYFGPIEFASVVGKVWR
jgi:signal peptidase I